MSTAAEAASPLSCSAGASALSAFSGTIKPAKPGVLYTLGLAIVAFAMVLLPLIYLALIVLTTWLVWLHLRYDTWVMASGAHGSLLKVLILYLGPAIVGGILIFFMIKPFFAAKAKAANPLSLDPAKEPLLFEFVKKICTLVRAPTPCRIDIDCEVNASARLQRGLLSKDLVLTIGLPLVCGLDTRQFAGVLAHEFGHFAQGAGMRFTYVIRRINFWFARVVYERDEWDLKLERSARGSDWRLAIVLHTARACVWLTRRILSLLMRIGHGISCFMLRQMEYDADSYESKIAGSDAFETTAARLRVLHAATRSAYQDVKQSWTSKRLPENLPLLIGHKAGSLPTEVPEKLVGAAAAAKTGWFDTHPSDADRVRAARRLNERGVFHLPAPASELFADFTQLSRDVTRHEYENKLELQFTQQNLMPADEILRESNTAAEAESMIVKFYGGVNISLQPLLVSASLPGIAAVESSAADWRAACQAAESLREEAGTISEEIVELQEKLSGFHSAITLLRAGFKLELGAFGLPPQATTSSEQEQAAQKAIQDTNATITASLARLDPFMSALRHRVELDLGLTRTPAVVLTRELADELSTALPLLVAVAAEQPNIHEIGIRLGPFSLLAQNAGNSSRPSQVEREAAQIMTSLHALIAGIQKRLAGFPYPFPHALGKVTVAEYLRNDASPKNEWQRIYEEGRVHVDRWFTLHYRLLGLVLACANEIEPVFSDCSDTTNDRSNKAEVLGQGGGPTS